MEKVIAMVLAGGRGKRMDILCHWRPKPVLPFAGSFRVIDFALSNCLFSGYRNIAALVDYRRDDISDYMRRWHSANNGEGHLEVLQPKTGSYAGTADAVYQNLDYLARQDTDVVLVLAADHIYQMDYREMFAAHLKAKADVTVGVVEVPIEETHRFGTVSTSADGRIAEFVEKSPSPRSRLASMGIYMFNRAALVERLTEDARKPDSAHDFGYAVLPAMVERDRVFAHRFEAYWQDIGTVEAYYQANMDLLRARPSLRLDRGIPLMTDNRVRSAHCTGPNGRVVNSLVGPGCMVDGYVENSVLAPGVRVAEKAEVRDALVMANVRVGYHSVISRSVLDEGVSVGKFCYVGFGIGRPATSGEITLLGKGVDLPPATAVGRRCKIMPDVGPAAFAGGVIPSGSTVFAAGAGS